MRVAVYYAPAVVDPLWTAACDWLGWDAERGVAVAQPDVAGIVEFTADPRVYGFHCTLKPPMRLATDYAAFVADVAALAADIGAFPLPGFRVADLSGFLAVREAEPSRALQELADRCVERLDRHRAPPDEAELARRRGGGLSPAREANLVRWGYPLVFGEWRFHMTLTRRLTSAEQAHIRPAAEGYFRDALRRERVCDEICVFTQAPGQNFRIAERFSLRR